MTITQMIGKFATAFSSLTYQADITFSNYVNNTIIYKEDEADDSCLIHVRFKSIIITDICLFSNVYDGIFKKCKLISSDSKNLNLAIVKNCFTDEQDSSKFNVDRMENMHFVASSNFSTYNIEQLNLGDCEGVKTADQLIIS